MCPGGGLIQFKSCARLGPPRAAGSPTIRAHASNNSPEQSQIEPVMELRLPPQLGGAQLGPAPAGARVTPASIAQHNRLSTGSTIGPITTKWRALAGGAPVVAAANRSIDIGVQYRRRWQKGKQRLRTFLVIHLLCLGDGAAQLEGAHGRAKQRKH